MDLQKIDVLFTLVEKELKAKYKRAVLGYVWSVFQPLTMAFVIYIAFQSLMRFNTDNYALFLLTGLFLWQWITVSINNSLHTYVYNAPIIKKVYVDKKLLVMAVLLTESLHFLISIPILFLFSTIYTIKDYTTYLYIPLLFLLNFLFLFGLTLIASSLNVIFRDMERITHTILQLGFYASPVIYPLSIVPNEYKQFILLNPFTYVVESWHGAFLGNLEIKFLFYYFFISLISLILGLIIHKKLEFRIVEYL